MKSPKSARADARPPPVLEAPAAPLGLLDRVQALAVRLADLKAELLGDPVKARYQEAQAPAIRARLGRVVDYLWQGTKPPTATQRQVYELAAEAFQAFLPRLQTFLDRDLKALEQTLDAEGAPWTPGRNPNWVK